MYVEKKKPSSITNNHQSIVLDVGMGIAIGAGALLVGGKTIDVFLFLCFCIDIFIAGGLAILGGKI